MFSLFNCVEYSNSFQFLLYLIASDRADVLVSEPVFDRVWSVVLCLSSQLSARESAEVEGLWFEMKLFASGSFEKKRLVLHAARTQAIFISQ